MGLDEEDGPACGFIVKEAEENRMFSYDDYKEIIRIIQSTGRQCGYAEALNRDSFIIMRHDVEYSVDRAWQLAKVEQSMDFTSTFFFSGQIIPIISYLREIWILSRICMREDRTSACILP